MRLPRVIRDGIPLAVDPPGSIATRTRRSTPGRSIRPSTAAGAIACSAATRSGGVRWA